MALPYSSPSSSHPGTPLNLSRPGTPSKFARSIPSMLSGLVQDAENPAVLEKQHLTSTSRHSSNHSLGGPSGSGSGPLPRSLRALAPHFTSLNVRIPRTGKVLLIPIPSALVSTSNYAHNSPRSANFTSPHTPRRGPATGIGSQGHGSYNPLQPPRKRPSLLGYLVLFLVTLFCILRLRHHRPNITIPFVPSSTNILDDEQIARLWQWEIGRGHYPSSRRTPSSLNLGGLNNPGVDASSWDFHPLPGDAKTAGLPKGPSRFPAEFPGIDAVRPVGPKRHYLNISEPQRHALAAPPSPYPPRPEPNSILDLDIVMDHCDFTANRYVRDCLEVLRTGAGLDKQHRLRRGKMDHWKHLYTEERKLVSAREAGGSDSVITEDGKDVLAGLGYVQKDPHALNPGAAREHQRTFIAHSTGTGVSHAQVEKNLRPPNLPLRQNIVGHGSEARPHPTHPTADPMCDPDYPKIFHIFWAGPFTDKPYLAVQSFLYTQNLGLHLDPNSAQMREFLQTTCRPQLWVWINPGPAASLPNPHARSQMFESLRDNPWSAPFLHDRFSQAVKFRMWNTTEQLDGIPELRDHWRSLPLFNSGGVKYGTPSQQQPADDEEEEAATAEQDSATEGEGVVPQAEEEQRGRFGTEADHVDAALAVKGGAMNATAAPESVTKRNPRITSPSRPKKKKDDELINRIGSTSSSGYDRLTVVLSDMARFVLTHRFGGVYLDADTIFLRDWEELWGWKGAFAYRWSRLEKYNTAVLKMQRNSAIGSFLFKSALANGLDFHPMTISRYTKDANVEGLLLRLPDALFDSAWLNTEYYQRDRPPYPYFKRFEDFFDPPKEDSAAPLALGFEGFFRGAFSYHFHNFWWIPFDPARNWPDLGPRFVAGERVARARAVQARLATERAAAASASSHSAAGGKRPPSPTQPPVNAPVAGPTGAQKQQQQQSGAGAEKGRSAHRTDAYVDPDDIRIDDDDVRDDEKDLGWATVLKRTFEQYLREEAPNMYGEWLRY